MASNDQEPYNPPGGPYFTQRLFSEEVAIAAAQSGDPITTQDVAYEFSNGQRFVSTDGQS